MLIARRIARGVNATVAGVMLGAAAVVSADPDLPGPAETRRAFDAVASWVADGRVPDAPQAIDPPGAAGACVTLRSGGRVIGRGLAMTGDGLAAWRAAREAWGVAAAKAPEDAAARVAIDLQIAGELKPLVGDDFDAAAASVNPGWHGVAGRVGNRVEALFPGQILERRLAPSIALGLLGALHDMPALDLTELRARGFRPYRFGVTHIAQVSAGESARFLYRGGQVVPAIDAMRRATLRAFADRAARHLMTHRWTGPEPHGMHGRYLPVIDAYRPPVAGPREQAVAVIALASYADAPGAGHHDAIQARNAARAILRDLTEVTEFEQDPLTDIGDAAAVLLACSRVRTVDPAGWLTEPELEEFGRQAAARLHRGVQTDGWAEGLPPAVGALVACALANAGSWDPDGAMRDEAASLVRALLPGVPTGELIALMPWIVWAEVSLAGPDGPIPSATALREVRAAAWRFQIVEADLTPDGADLLGGMVFTRGASVLPTAQQVRPTAGFAAMLLDARLTEPDEVLPEMSSLAASMRFLMQLSIREAETHLAVSPRRALGGVRNSLWDYEVSIDATALALVSACDLLRAMEARLGTPEE